MRYFLEKHDSDSLIIFFAGWGCDENQFANLKDKKDVLIVYDYQNLDLDFDFSSYGKIDLIAYSAGVFVASVWKPDCKIGQKVAINGNPYLFDEKLGLSSRLVEEFRAINLDNYLEFRRKYMVETDEEYQKYNQLESRRSLESCQAELSSLQKLYEQYKDKLIADYDKVILSDDDQIFNLQAQQQFYHCPIKIVSESKHHLFFKFSSFEEILNY